MPFPFFNTVTEMPFMSTRLGMIVKRGKLLNDELMWLEAFDNELKGDIVKWIKERLITTGENADGEIIGLYSPVTEMINPEKIAGTPYTLFDSGEFQKSIIVLAFREEIVIAADPMKGETNLFTKFGENIIDLNKKQKNELRKRIKAKYLEIIRRTLFNGA